MESVQRTCRRCQSSFDDVKAGQGKHLRICPTCRATPLPANTAPCEVAECGKSRYQDRKYCSTHAMRLHRYGNLNEDRTRRRTEPCKADGCAELRWYRAGWCKVHMERVRRHGDPHMVIDRNPQGSINSSGYRVRYAPKHPLATANGKVLDHRRVLYAKIGPGEHRCHWCGTSINWDESWPVDAGALVVDHVDHQRANNDPDNLVPSCFWCNRDRRV